MTGIGWKPDKTDKTPFYRQIINFISRKIANGDWVIGQKLPPQRRLAEIFGVNRSTVVEALDELASLGIVEGRAGGGTVISNNTWSLLMSQSAPNWQRYIESSAFKANTPTVQMINTLEYDPEIVRLGTGEMSPELVPFDMMGSVLDRIPQTPRTLTYLEPLGLPELREEIRGYLSGFGIDVPISGILIVSGALQAIQLISVCMLPPQSTVFTEAPSYINSLHIFQSAGMILEGVHMDREGVVPWMLSQARFKPDQSILYTIPTFQNPTGIVMPQERRKEVLQHCMRNRIPIIEDDIFRELWIDEPPPPPVKAYDANGVVLYIGSVSKCLAPGLRVGWLIGPESVIQRIGDVKMQMDYGSSSLSQWAVKEWLESGFFDENVRRLRKSLKKRRDFVLQVLDVCYKDIAAWEKPGGGYYVWLKLNREISTDKIFDRALNEKLLITPGSIFDVSKSQYIRISYAYASLEALEKGLKRLAEIIRDS
ncbi:MAG: PLP-dependent aminotransferase family protein, partial [Clostridiales Family XIII bacterium]|jgi:GntR family transcriptional regulator of abcA and norABC|nr:PLP-dependent aminotransferase family protein [Clostridiales Family XIII bacterium]